MFFLKQRQKGLEVMKEEYHKNSHFKLGTAPGMQAFGRMSDVHYKHYSSVDRHRMVDKNNSKKSNFKLGNWIPSMRTTVIREFH